MYNLENEDVYNLISIKLQSILLEQGINEIIQSEIITDFNTFLSDIKLQQELDYAEANERAYASIYEQEDSDIELSNKGVKKHL